MRWPSYNTNDLIRFYGNPANGEVARHLVRVVPPFQMYYDGKPIKSIAFHKKAAPYLKAALDEIWEHCGHNQATIDHYRLSHYSGAYNPRRIRGSRKWSNHAFGCAIDLDAAHNGFNTGHGTMPAFAVSAFKRQGARWGGDYHHRTDPMHFEFAGGGVSSDAAEHGPVHVDGHAVGEAEQVPLPPPKPPAPYVPEGPDDLGTYIDDYTNKAEKVKSVWSSKINWVAKGIAGAGAAGTVAKDPSLWDKLKGLALDSSVWFILLMFVGVGLLGYFYWRDHGKGRQ